MIRWLNDWCATFLGIAIFFAMCAPHLQDAEGEPSDWRGFKRD